MMMPGEWQSLRRRKGRALLTIAGMACGVFAFVLLAGVSEQFQSLAEHFSATFEGRLYVCEKLSFWAGGGIIDEDKAARARAVPGVAEVIPAIIGRLQTDRLVVVGLPLMLVGIPAAQSSRLWPGAQLADGRWIDAKDATSDHAVVGSDVAHALGARVGARVRLLDRDWTVVGILAHSGAIEDRQMLVPLPCAQRALGREGLVTSVVVVPAPDIDPERLAPALGAALPRLEIVSPSRLAQEADGSLRLWRALVLGCGLIAAATGTLCIVITMTVSVTEQTHEIGLRKAIGASNGQIVADVLAEAALLATLGWAIGSLAAGGFVWRWNEAFRQEGLFLFSLTPRVVFASALATLALGLLGGAVPALSAARLDPVAALRRRG